MLLNDLLGKASQAVVKTITHTCTDFSMTLALDDRLAESCEGMDRSYVTWDLLAVAA